MRKSKAMKQTIDIPKTIKSFKYAGAGIGALFKYENNAKVHIMASLMAIAFGFYFNIAFYEWIAVSLAIGLVMAAEAFNTAIEKLADIVSPEYHEGIKAVKDLAAAAVLILAITAAIIGCIIFAPKFYYEIIS